MNKTTVSEKEIDEGLKKSSVDYKVYFLFSPSKKTADSLSAVISQGKNLEDFAHNGSGNSQWEIDSAIARWGDVDERMEQQIYAMKLNETSRPFPLDDGWYIVKLIGKTMTFMTGKEEEENKRERVVSVIRHRKEMKRMSAYMETALKNTSTTIETKLFNEIVVRCWNIVFTRYQRLDTMVVPIDHEIVSSTISSLPDRGKGVLVVFPDGYWSAKKTLEKVAQSGLTIPHPSQRSLSLLLEQRIKDLIDQEYLTRIGYQMKLNQSSAVRNDLAVWRDAFIAGDVRNRIGDTISVSQKDIREIQSVFKADSIVVRSDSAAEAKSRSLKLADDVNRIAGSTANDQPITIFRPTLDSLQVTRTPAMVFRILGFGGRMFAVPFVNPQVGWIQYWQKKEEVLP